MNVNAYVIETLKDIGVPVSFLALAGKTKPPIYVTFFELASIGTDYMDDKATTNEVRIQVDVWAKLGVSITSIKENVISAMKEKGWACRIGPDLYENENNMYHKVLEFTYKEAIQ